MTEPTAEHHPFGYRWHERFPNATRVAGFEGGAVFAADAEGAFWLIKDEGTMADFLDSVEDADLLARLVTLERFTDRQSRDDAVARMIERHRRAHDGSE